MTSIASLRRAAFAAPFALLALLPTLTSGQAPSDATPPDRTELTLPQARDVARRALASGQTELAYRLAQGLLQADANSSFAHFVLAKAQSQLGQTNEARKSAATAYRYAENSLRKFEAAELAARLSYALEQPTRAQFWLRRAVQNAPNDQIETQLARDFGRLRAENPFHFSLRGGIRPSTNVNNGADTAVQTIDGSPIVGTLSGDAQALSGLINHAEGAVKYRLRSSKRSRTELTARLFVQRITLSREARELSPNTPSSDFGSTYAEVGVTHDFAVGSNGGSAQVAGAIGQYWSGQNPYYRFARLDLSRNWRVSGQTRLSLDGTYEMRGSALSSYFDSQVWGATAGLRHRLKGGDGLSFSLNLRQTDSDFSNARSVAKTFYASYAFADQIGPAKVSAGLVLGHSNYSEFRALYHPSVGRQDKSAYADINLFFPDIDYAGFAPTLKIRTGRKFSNISRYDTREVSVSLGIQSKF